MGVFVSSLLFVLLLAIVPVGFAADTGGAEYQSPYGVKLPWPIPELIPDLLEGKRGEPGREAKIPESDWYGHSHPWVGPWGPLPHRYKPPKRAEGKSDDWERARIIATALRFIGYHYRHHYIPDWDPPPGWYNPKPGGARHDGKGLDCSNFTAFVYNQGLGIRFSSDIRKQAATETVTVNGTEQQLPVRLIPRQESVEAWVKVLKPGDLLFIRPRSSETVSHVVIWIGQWGVPGGQPLILDSHGADVRDEDGTLIPDGVHLRPFRPNSWYATRADHAIRIIGP
ncbi:MAG: NlpC/P60 family protein [Geobacter sp.]|nr:NlpC/P60 family protein [Geobacter sp.]